MGGNFNRRQPRAESRPLAPEELTGAQKRALKGIGEYVATIAENEPQESAVGQPWSSFVPPIDSGRSNHVFLIDGARGSGKSAVLVTLLKEWSDALGDGGEQAIVPIGLIDLHPMDPGTHLMVHVVGQFKRLVETLQGEQPGGGQRLWQPGEELAGQRAWRRFVRIAAAAWESGFERRKQKLGPEEYAFELEERERERLNIDRAFRDFVDALVADYLKWAPSCGKRPTFVIGIDDADMNTRRARELLDLLRALWHPRVVFVLTGDSGLFLDILRRNVAEDLGEGASRVESLARDIYDKAVPVAHRFELPELSPTERVTKLEKFVEAAGLMHEALVEPVRELLALCRAKDQNGAGLPGRLRRLQQIAHALARAKSFDLAGLLYVLLEDARRNHRGSWPYSWRYAVGQSQLSQLRLDAAEATWKLVWVHHVDTHLRGQMRLLRMTEFQLLIPERVNREGNEIPDEELLEKSASERVSGMALLVRAAQRAPERERAIYMYTRSVVNARWIRIWFSDHGRSIRWRFPRWRDVDRVLAATERWLEATREIPAGVDEPIAWLAAMCLRVVLEQSRRSSPEVLDANGAIQWNALAEAVVESMTADDPALIHWARTEAVLLAAPESGLSHGPANQWLHAFYGACERRQLKDHAFDLEIHRRRRNRAMLLASELDHFDRANPHHEFADVTGFRDAAQAARDSQLIDGLGLSR